MCYVDPATSSLAGSERDPSAWRRQACAGAPVPPPFFPSLPLHPATASSLKQQWSARAAPGRSGACRARQEGRRLDRPAGTLRPARRKRPCRCGSVMAMEADPPHAHHAHLAMHEVGTFRRRPPTHRLPPPSCPPAHPPARTHVRACVRTHEGIGRGLDESGVSCSTASLLPARRQPHRRRGR